MNKKITKTIMTIVFVVFLGFKLGIERVDADTVFKTCTYSNGNENMTLQIDKGFGRIVVKKGDSTRNNIVNWTEKSPAISDEYKSNSSFYGYEYFMKNDEHQCPPIILDVEYTSAYYTFFADEGSKDNVKDSAKKMQGLWTFNVKEFKYKSETHGDAYYDDDDDDSNNNGTITPKSCKCTGKKNKENIIVEFKVNSSLSKPRVTIHIGESKNDEDINNWTTPYGSSNYTYVNDVAESNSCPTNAIVAISGIKKSKLLLVSDAKNLSDVQKASKKHGLTDNPTLHTLSCTEVEEETIDEEDEPPVEERPDPNDPGVNVSVGRLDSKLTTFSCGEGFVSGVPGRLIKTISFIYKFLQVLVPIVLIILGSLDLVKAIMGQKEDEIKKGQQIFVKRLVGAVLVFFVFAIIKFLVSILVNTGMNQSVIQCLDCFISGEDSNMCTEES